MMIVDRPYGFIYITTNLVNGKRYVGQKKISDNDRCYLGSGTLLKKAISKYGKENFVKNIVSFANTFDELNKMEQDLIAFFNASNSDDFYNIELGGQKYPLSEHTKQLISQNHSDMSGANNPNYGKKMSEEQKRKISEAQSGKIAYNKGIPMSDAQKQKLKEAWKNRKVTVGHHTEITCVETGITYFSIEEASRQLGIKVCSISAVLSGKRNKVFGKHFVYTRKEKNNRYE